MFEHKRNNDHLVEVPYNELPKGSWQRVEYGKGKRFYEAALKPLVAKAVEIDDVTPGVLVAESAPDITHEEYVDKAEAREYELVPS